MNLSGFSSSKRNLAIAIIIMVGVGLQLFMMFFVLEDPGGLNWVDSGSYYRIAKGLYEGKPYSVSGDENSIYRSPGYPFSLAAMMYITGPSIIGIRLLHIALFPVFLLTLYKLGAVLVNARVGAFAVLLAAFYPLYIYVPLSFYPESLLIYLFAIGSLLLYYEKRKHSYLTVTALAVTISLAVMMRPTAIVLIPVSLFYLLWASRAKMAYMLRLALLLVLLPMACVGSWMLRNYHVHGCAVFTTAGSINLLYGYNEQSTWKSKSDSIPSDGEFDKEVFNAKPLAEKEKLRFAKVREFIVNHPGRVLKMIALRSLDLWNPIPRTTTTGGMAQLKFKLANALIYVPLVVLGAIGFVVYRRNPLVQTFFLLTLLNTVGHGIVGVSVRYRAVTDFTFIVMAAATLNLLVVKYLGWKDLSEDAQVENPPSTPGSDHFRAPGAPEQSA